MAKVYKFDNFMESDVDERRKEGTRIVMESCDSRLML